MNVDSINRAVKAAAEFQSALLDLYSESVLDVHHAHLEWIRSYTEGEGRTEEGCEAGDCARLISEVFKAFHSEEEEY